MKRQYKCRFHLGAGKNFMHWRVENVATKEVTFYNPEHYQIVMRDCFLRNQKTTAKKIHEGDNKTVCAWIEAANVIVFEDSGKTPFGDKVSYNPKITPNWVINGENADGQTMKTIITKGRTPYKHQ